MGKVALAVAAAVAVVVVALWAAGLLPGIPDDPERAGRMREPVGDPPAGMQVATFGGGCFWCTEAVFQQLKGVHWVVPGYCGGTKETANYAAVCSKTTDHAEVIQITYDPSVVSFDTLLEVHWKTHDPTTPNQQGADRGPQYRSVIFYHDDEQKERAKHYKKKLEASGAFDRPIVTQIVPAMEFYPAEDYHQNYYANNPGQGYCRAVIVPKLKKFEAAFADKLKPAPGSSK